MKRVLGFTISILMLGALGSAAASSARAAESAKVPEAAKKEAQELFANRCTPCHGATGRGDGPASAGLTPRPRDFADAEWQKSITDDHIDKIIKFGGAAVGKSVAMPPNPDLMAKPQVVGGLREIVREAAKK